MTNILIEQDSFIDICKSRIEFWLADKSEVTKYLNKIKELIDKGILNSEEPINIKMFIDNLVINDMILLK